MDVVSSTYSSGVSAYQRTAATDTSFSSKVGFGTDTSSSYADTSAKSSDSGFGPATIDSTPNADNAKAASAYAKASGADQTEKDSYVRDSASTEKTQKSDKSEEDVSLYDKMFGAQQNKKGRYVQDKVSLSQEAEDTLTALEKLQEGVDTSLEFAQANTPGLQLVAQNLEGTSFAGTDLSTANLSFSVFTDADFSGANLQGTNFLNADVTGVSFDGADLRGADLSGVTGLTGEQLYQSKYDSSTKLPFNLTA